MPTEDTPDSSTLEVTTHGAAAAGPLDGERRHLLVFHGASSWMFQLPAEGAVVIGRAETADLQLDDASISRQHARLAFERGGVTLVDLGSHNGTFVNREPVRGERRLVPGDVISIHQTTLIFHATTPLQPPALVLDDAAFRRRLEDELDRAVRFARNFAVLVMIWPAAVVHRPRVERAIEAELRRIDAVTWRDGGSAHVLLAEAAPPAVDAFAARLRGRLGEPRLRVGYATCPRDGADLDALLAGAAKAAAGAGDGETIGAGHTHQTMAIGSQRVIVADPAIVRLYALVDRLAPIDLPVLVTGETGSGKEVVATAIHARSPRRLRPLVTLNCAAIPETLVESAIFGHEKGAFSGAVATKAGLLEAADRSTLFLDEIGELAAATQAKLLRVLETGRFTRVGEVHEREVDVRIVAATNRDLEEEVAAGRFRQDLYFRLSGATLYLPPLRERPREIALLATTFLDQACARVGRGPMRISEPAMRALLAYTWPGNVRELKNLMHYVAAAFPEAELLPEHVQERITPRSRTPSGSIEPIAQPAAADAARFRPLADEIRELEIARMRAALEATGGNQTRAAALLSVPIRTFTEKVKQYGLGPRRKREESGS